MKWCLVFLFLTAACGYHFNPEEANCAAFRTINVPYIKNDPEGKLTSALIHHLSSSGYFRCVPSDGDFTLNVVVKKNYDEGIGWRYEHHGLKGKRLHRLVPVENRRYIITEVSLINNVTGEIVIEPTVVKADAEYDFVDYNSIRDLLTFFHGEPRKTINFSLGQLDSIEGAQDDVTTPLFRHLSQKIVDGLITYVP